MSKIKDETVASETFAELHRHWHFREEDPKKWQELVSKFPETTKLFRRMRVKLDWNQ